MQRLLILVAQQGRRRVAPIDDRPPVLRRGRHELRGERGHNRLGALARVAEAGVVALPVRRLMGLAVKGSRSVEQLRTLFALGTSTESCGGCLPAKKGKRKKQAMKMREKFKCEAEGTLPRVSYMQKRAPCHQGDARCKNLETQRIACTRHASLDRRTVCTYILYCRDTNLLDDT